MATIVGGIFDVTKYPRVTYQQSDVISNIFDRLRISENSFELTTPTGTEGGTLAVSVSDKQGMLVTTSPGTTVDIIFPDNETNTGKIIVVAGHGDVRVVSNTYNSTILGGAGSDYVDVSGLIPGGKSSTAEANIVSVNGIEDIYPTGSAGNYLNGFDGNDKLITNIGADTLIGGEGNDTLSSGVGNDLLVTGVGNDIVDGGAGFDVAQMSGSASDYRITTANGSTLVSHATNGSTSDISNVQYVQLDNGQALVFADSTQQAAITTLYQTAFGRTAEAAGLQYWFDRAAAGVSLDQIAKEFTASAEYANTGGKLDDSAFIHSLYQNTLGRTAEDAGHAYWLHALTHGGATRDQLIKSFASIAAQHIDGSLQGEVNIVGSVTIIEGII
jgi:hypothetical protein